MFIQHKWSPLLLALALVWLPEHINAGEKLTLSVGEAVSTALKNNHALIIGTRKIAERQSGVAEAKSAFLPQVSGTANYTRLDVAPYISLGNSPMGAMMPPGTPSKITMGDDDMYDLGVSVQQPLFTGFALKSSYEIARTALEAERDSKAMTEVEIVYQVQKAYYELMNARETGKVTEHSVALMEAHVGDLERLVETGIATNNDLLKARVQLSEMKLADLKVKNGARLAEKALCTILGIPVDTAIDLTSMPEYNEITVDPAALEKTAYANRPDLSAVSKSVEVSRKSVIAARSQFYPQLAAVYNFSYKRPNREYEAEFYDSWTAGIVMQLNIFDWGKTKSRMDQAKMRQLQAEESKKQLIDTISLEVEQAYLSLNEAGERVSLTREAMEQAEENYRITRQKFSEGLLSNTEVLDAATALTRAGVEFVNAQSDFRIAKAYMDRATGERTTQVSSTGDNNR